MCNLGRPISTENLTIFRRDRLNDVAQRFLPTLTRAGHGDFCLWPPIRRKIGGYEEAVSRVSKLLNQITDADPQRFSDAKQGGNTGRCSPRSSSPM